ncbi:MAG: transposase, partial [Bacteroidota bacterium]
GLIEDDDIFEKIPKIFDFNFIYDEVKHVYCDDNGRPPCDPIMLYKATLVQRLKKLSDPEMEYAARYDIRIKHFIGIPIEDFGFDFSTLSKFRTRLGSELFERIFQKILSQIVKLGIIKNSEQQYLDSMPVLAHAALPSVTCLIYQGIKNTVENIDESLKKEVFTKTSLTKEKLHYYSKARPLFKLEDSEKKKAFEKAVNRARTVIQFLESREFKSEEINLLKQIINENVDDINQPVQTERAIRTIIDPEAKIGHKTKEDLIFGYKNHAAVTEEGIITAVAITSAAEKDDKQIETIISKQKEAGLKPKQMDADSAYGYIETFKIAERNGVTLNAPLRGFDENGTSVYELKFDAKKNTLTCLNNICVKGSNLKFTFPIRQCRHCPKKDLCPLSPGKVVMLNKEHKIAREAVERQRSKTEEKRRAKEKGLRPKSRLIIENVFAYLEKLGGKITPYFGLAKTTIHVLLAATVSNIMKTARLLG